MRQAQFICWFLLHPSKLQVRFLTTTTKPSSTPAPKMNQSRKASAVGRKYFTTAYRRRELMLVKAHSNDEATNFQSVRISSKILRDWHGKQDLAASVDANNDLVAVSVLVATTGSWYRNHIRSRINQLIELIEASFPVRSHSQSWRSGRERNAA